MAGDLPEELLLRPPLGKRLGLVAGSAAFVAAGVWMVQSGVGWKGWLVLVVFGTSLLATLAMLLPGAAYLYLHREGFVYCSLFRRHSWLWSDVSDFAVFQVNNVKMVGFNATAQGPSAGYVGRFNSSAFGREMALPDTYGLEAESLAAILSLWQERALAGEADKPGDERTT
jgi:hypothetical protein